MQIFSFSIFLKFYHRFSSSFNSHPNAVWTWFGIISSLSELWPFMGVAICPFLIWPSHFLDSTYVPVGISLRMVFFQTYRQNVGIFILARLSVNTLCDFFTSYSLTIFKSNSTSLSVQINVSDRRYLCWRQNFWCACSVHSSTYIVAFSGLYVWTQIFWKRCTCGYI